MNEKPDQPTDGADVQKALEQDAFYGEVRMPEIEKQATAAEAKVFGETLRLWMAERKLSQTAIGEKIGVSPAVISQIIHGKYTGDTTLIIKKVSSFMDTFDRRNRVEKGKGFVDTTVAKKIYTIIKQTQIFSDEHEAKIGLIIGDAGHGKSLCLKQYADVHFSDSIYVVLDDTMSSAAMFAEIAKELRIDSTGGLKTLTQRIVSRLAGREMVVILDEASGLDVHKLNLLRQIIGVRCKCPMVFAGNSHLRSTLNQDVSRRGFESLDQIRSRLLCTLNLDELAANPAGGLYTAEDIRRLYEYGGISLTKEAISSLRKICMTPQTGRLRTCSVIIAALHKASKIVEEGVITAEYILSAIGQLGLPIMDRLPMLADIERTEKQEAKAKTA